MEEGVRVNLLQKKTRDLVVRAKRCGGGALTVGYLVVVKSEWHRVDQGKGGLVTL